MLNKRILWWGRHGNYGPDYPRNRTIQSKMRELGCEIIEFQPKVSQLADLEALTKGFKDIDLVWVPCFRQRDLKSAVRWSKSRSIPVVFDPLISAYDKRVFEKNKFPVDSLRAKRLLQWEQGLFHSADVVIADTQAHADYFTHEFKLPQEKLVVIPVSAEESLFKPDVDFSGNATLEFLFFGTFIGLQGSDFIVRSLSEYKGPKIKVTLMGEGPDKALCEELASSIQSVDVEVAFEGWVPIKELPARIQRADACLGIFGEGKKTQRVIPNKVYQALACGKPVITLKSPAYPKGLLVGSSAVVFLDELNSHMFVDLLARLSMGELDVLKEHARPTYDRYFSNEVVAQQLITIFNALT